MRRHVLLDAGPLVALLDPRDHYHRWAATRWVEIDPPLLTCEAALTEACFLIAKSRGSSAAVIELVSRRAISIPFHVQEEARAVATLMQRYANVPMSFADACLVRMAEQHAESEILTLDRHFTVYRRHGRQMIPTIMPT